jgi:starch synthase
MAVRVEFSDTLARQIIAGSDLFLMPSRYEPCGLTQMYSMLYGTVPIVRETGGLADTVVDADPETIEQGSANGFTFQGESDDVLTATIGRALNCWYQERETWNRIVRNCMAKDWSWQNSARKYAEFYAQTLARLK